MAKAPINLKIIGDNQLRKKFARLVGKEQKKIIKKAMRETYAKPVAARARQLVPADKGALAKTIKVRTAKLRGRPKPIGFAVTAGVGLPDLYASFVELGSAKQPPQSFLRRAADELAPRADQRIGEQIGKLLTALAVR